MKSIPEAIEIEKAEISRLAELLEERRMLRAELGLQRQESTQALMVTIGPGKIKKQARRQVAKAVADFRGFAVQMVNHKNRETLALAIGGKVTSVFLDYGLEELQAQLLSAVARFVSLENSLERPVVERTSGNLPGVPHIEVPVDWEYCFVPDMTIDSTLLEHFPAERTGFVSVDLMSGTDLRVKDEEVDPMVRQQEAWVLLRKLQSLKPGAVSPQFSDEKTEDSEADADLMTYINELPLMMPSEELDFEKAVQGVRASSLAQAVAKLATHCAEQGLTVTQQRLSVLTRRFFADSAFMAGFEKEIKAINPQITQNQLMEILWSSCIQQLAITQVDNFIEADVTNEMLNRAARLVKSGMNEVQAVERVLLAFAPVIRNVQVEQGRKKGVVSPELTSMLFDIMPETHGSILQEMKSPSRAYNHLGSRLQYYVNGLRQIDPNMDEAMILALAQQEMEKMVLDIFEPFADAICAYMAKNVGLPKSTENKMVLRRFTQLCVNLIPKRT